MNHQKPNYRKIYEDMIRIKFPDKLGDYQGVLSKKELSALDVIKLNASLFGTFREEVNINGRHRSYSRSDIFEILDYQKKRRLNNSQLALHFGLSRNTVAHWKKIYIP